MARRARDASAMAIALTQFMILLPQVCYGRRECVLCQRRQSMAQASELDYPFKNPADNRFALSWRKRAPELVRSIRGVIGRRRDDGVRIWPLRAGGSRPLGADDIALVFVVKDSLRFMRSFLRHYRTIGVSRFLCVDDASSDGTREFLAAQPDVDVFASNVDYRGAMRSRRWRELLFEAHGRDRWYLNVDADEFLMFDRCEERSVRDLIAVLEGAGERRSPAPMIDAYPASGLSGAKFDGDTDALPWTVADHIDRSGYRLRTDGLALRLTGGVRRRVFGVECEMMKYPLIYWSSSVSLGKTIHRPTPAHPNFAPIRAILLHFKIFEDFESDVRRIIEAGQHHNDSGYYRQIAERLAKDAKVALTGPVSLPLTSSAALRDAGFFAGFD